MSVSMNERIAKLVDAVADDPAMTDTTVATLDSGARVIDCGAGARGGLNAGLVFASACMGGFGRVEPAPVRVGERTWPGVGVSVDRPAAACLASQYAGWKLEHEKFFAMASGRAGRSLAPSRCSRSSPGGSPKAPTSRCCAWRHRRRRPEVVEKVASRCGVRPERVAFLIAPTASICGSVQISARVVETAMHKLHELGVDPERVRYGWGCCPVAPVAKDDPTAIGRTNDAVLYAGTVHLWLDASDDEVADLATKLPSSSSDAFGTPFGELLKAADWKFYDIDPMLFSPAEVTLTSAESGRAHHGGGLEPAVLERSFSS